MGAKGVYVAGWSFTNTCNLRCMHCYNSSGSRHPDELTYRQAVAVARKLIDFGVDAINFGGGECPLRKEFFGICRLLHDAGIKLSLTTNGLTYKKTARYLGLFHDIGVSIDFADAKRHNAFRGVDIAHKKATDAVRFFAKKGADTEVVTCITRLNCSGHDMEGMLGLVEKLGANYWRLNRYRPTGRGNMDRLELSPYDLKSAYEFLNSRIADRDFMIPDPLFSILGRKARECPAGKTSFRIMADGRVSPCVYLHESGGNIAENQLDGILDSPIFRAIRNRNLENTKCARCAVRETCKGGCAGSAYLKHGTFDAPDPLCWLGEDDGNSAEDWNVHEMYLCTAYVPIRRNHGIGCREVMA